MIKRDPSPVKPGFVESVRERSWNGRAAKAEKSVEAAIKKGAVSAPLSPLACRYARTVRRLYTTGNV
jgi:hypothetical protein